jgi:hypothetical protein
MHKLILTPGAYMPLTIDLGPLKRVCPIRLADRDALAEPGYHVAGKPFQRLLWGAMGEKPPATRLGSF